MCIHLNPESNLDKVWKELELLGLEILYSNEGEDGLKVLFANAHENIDLTSNKNIAFTTPYTLPLTDWVQQYQDHGLNFYEGSVHVDLKDFGYLNPLFNPIKIEPGPGFGDLSHPTTNLVLKLMSKQVQGRNVLDIGSGSGILSLAAVSMGALSTFGVDIDPEAILHSEKNRKLNGIDHLVSFGLSSGYKPSKNNNDLVILMNMIQSEQLQAWDSLKHIHHLAKDLLVSGILIEGRQRYLDWANSLNWKLVSEIEDSGWLAFHFST